MNDFAGTEVSHSTYGNGIITKADGNKLFIHFANGAEKQFLFPDSIGKFLSTNNKELLEAAQAEKQAAIVAAEKQRQSKLEAEAQKQLLEAEKKKKTTLAKRKSTRAKKI